MPDTFNFSNYLEAKLYDHLLRTATFSKPATLAFALCSGVPVDSNTGANIPELANAAGYARVNYGAPADSGWQVDTASAGGANTLPIQWPTCTTTGWGLVSGIAILDSASFGAGNVLFWGALTTPRTVAVGDSPFLASGNLTITLD